MRLPIEMLLNGAENDEDDDTDTEIQLNVINCNFHGRALLLIPKIAIYYTRHKARGIT